MHMHYMCFAATKDATGVPIRPLGLRCYSQFDSWLERIAANGLNVNKNRLHLRSYLPCLWSALPQGTSLQ